MGVGERSRLIAFALLLAGLTVLCAPQIAAMRSAPPERPAPRPWNLCEAPAPCRPVDVASLRLDAPTTTLTTVFEADPAAVSGPLALHIAATASAEVRWNGHLIGTNGQVGSTCAQEVPGRFSALIPIPADQVRPGANEVEVRLSAHHLWAPVVRPIHDLSIGPWRDPLHGTLRHYLPTLLLTGLLALAFVGAAALWAVRRDPGGPLLTLLTGAVLGQAVAEASKLALTYSYPWQLARLTAVAGLAALAALALGLIAARFIPDRRPRLWLTAGLVLALTAALVLLPWWDAKALWAFRAGTTAVLISATVGGLAGLRGARTAQVAAVLALAISWTVNFLDTGYYLLALGLFAAVAARTARDLRTAPAVAAPAPDETLSIPDGASRHLIKAGDLLHVRADDDYSVVTLVDGRELLSTANLSALIRLAPTHLLRIHRSHAVNPVRIVAVHRTAAGHSVELNSGHRLPIGRTQRAAVEARLG